MRHDDAGEAKRSERDVPVVLSPWHPERDLIHLAVLGKFAEELGEAVAIVARCAIQGIEECEPETGKPNRVAVQNEIADILAGAFMMIRRFHLDPSAIDKRKWAKVAHLERWHELLRQRIEVPRDS